MNYSKPNLIAFIWSIPIVILFFLLLTIRIPLNFHSLLILKTLFIAIGFSVVTSVCLRKCKSIGVAILLGLVVLILMGLVPLWVQPFYWLSILILFIREFDNLKKFFNRSMYNKFTWIVITILLSVLPFYTLEYSQPNSMVKLINSQIHVDTLYHVAIASMWKMYHVISHGLHGTGALDYHYGSHLLMAGASKLGHFTAFESYSHFFGLFFIPLLSISSLAVAEEYLPSKDDVDFKLRLVFFSFLMLGTGALTSGSILFRFALWPSFYESESYTVSLILLFAFFSVLKNDIFNSLFSKALAIFAILSLTVVSKVSTGFCALAVLGSWALLTKEKWWTRTWYLQWVIFFTSAGLFLVLFQSINPGMSDASYQLFQFVNTYVDFQAPFWIKYSLFILFHFLFYLVASLIYLFSIKNKVITSAFPHWWLLGSTLTFLIGLGVVTCLYVTGGSGYYFSNIAMFMALPFLICLPSFFQGKMNLYLYRIIIAGMFISSAVYAPKALWAGGKKFLVYIKQQPAANEFSTFVKKLEAIRDESESKNSLIYIPRNEAVYWKAIDCRSAGYLISAISERPAIYGWPSTECYPFLCGPRFHSNGLCEKSQQIYSDGELLSEAKKMGFDRVDVITAKEVRVLK